MKFLWKFPYLYLIIDSYNKGLKNILTSLKGFKEIKSKDLFDEEYYLKNNEDVKLSEINPLLHYLIRGCKEGRNPHPDFDGRYYLNRYPDVEKSNLNPLIHYSIYGLRENRKINQNWDLIQNSGLFDEVWYKCMYGDKAEPLDDPVTHYLEIGAIQGNNPNPDFDGKWYLENYLDTFTNPLVHYIKFGKEKQFKTKPSPEDLVRVIQLTKDHSHNPYYTMIGNELISRNIDLTYQDDLDLVEQLINKKPGIIHLHQPENYYHGNNVSETHSNAIKFLDRLTLFKDLGAKIVVTMHNPSPHNRIFEEIDNEVSREIMVLADHIIVLCKYPKKILKDQGIKTPITVLLHPAYRSFYGDPVNKVKARIELGLPEDAIIFGYNGQIKPYKNLEFILEGFTQFLRSFESSNKPFLVIAGSSPDKNYSESLKNNYKSENIIIKPINLTDNELISHVCALDYSVFGFKDIWASGSVILSLSYCVPVIAPDTGCLGEYVEHLNNGLLYNSQDHDSFVETLKLAVNIEFYEHLRYMCNVYSEEHSVELCANELLEVYKKVAMGVNKKNV